MSDEFVHYHYVDILNPKMKVAYFIAKDFYQIRYWNKKAMPVAVIYDKSGNYISHGISGEGMHYVAGKCKRLGRPGTPYSDCKWCKEEEHAEIKALERVGRNFILGGSIYIYGHYRSCNNCINQLRLHGINKIYLVKGAKEKFDRHNKDGLIGKKQQFNI